MTVLVPENWKFRFIPDRPRPDPYNYPSDGDYYAALNEYNEWLEKLPDLEGEMIDISYERSLEEKWEQES